MNEVQIPGLFVESIAISVPKHTERSENLTWLSEEERNNIQTAIGIEERRTAQGISLRHLCKSSAQGLLDYTETPTEEIGLLVLVTQTSPLRIPSLAFELQDQLGLSHNCICMEVNWGCAGYIYGMWLVAQLLNYRPHGRKALLIAGDVSTTYLSKRDRSTVPLFSDAVSSTLLSKRKELPPAHFYLYSDASRRHDISLQSNHLGEETLHMDGMGVFHFAIDRVLPHLQHILKTGPWKKKEINYVVCHQASRIVCEAIRERLEVSCEQFPYSLKQWGNTSSASIPMTLFSSLSEQLSTSRQKLLLCGFGTGLCWGSMCWESHPFLFTPLIEC